MATRADWEAKVDEIAALIGRRLFGDGRLTDAQREEARAEAEDAVDAWEEAENQKVSGLTANDDLQRLLAEQHEIAEQILDVWDDEIRPDED